MTTSKNTITITGLIGAGITIVSDHKALALQLAVVFGLLSTVITSPALPIFDTAFQLAGDTTVQNPQLALDVITDNALMLIGIQIAVFFLFHLLMLPLSRTLLESSKPALEGGVGGLAATAFRITLQSIFAAILQIVLSNMIGFLVSYIAGLIGGILAVGLYFGIIVWLQFVFIALALILNALQACGQELKLADAFRLLSPINGVFTAATASLAIIGSMGAFFMMALLLTLAPFAPMLNVALALFSGSLFLIGATMIGAMKSVPHIAAQIR